MFQSIFLKLNNKIKLNIFNTVLLLVTLCGIIFIINSNLWLNSDLVFYVSTLLNYISPLFFVLCAILIRFISLRYISLEFNIGLNFNKNIEMILLFLTFIPLFLIIYLKNDFFVLNSNHINYIKSYLLDFVKLFIQSEPILANYAEHSIIFLKNTIIFNFFFDGISLWLSWLTLFIYYIVYCNKNRHSLYLKNQKYAWNKSVYNSMLEIIIVLMLVCFTTKNIYIFFVSFEMILIPLVIYITFNGSRFDKITAIKYLFVYTILGSVFLWVPVAYIVENIGTSNYENLQWLILNSINSNTRKLLFLSLFVGFSFKIPTVPMHHWLISAHVEAPTNGSIILAALLLKVGGYGIFRFAYNLFPLEVFFFSDELICWCIFGYTFATVQAVRQIDIKRYVAYTSIAHMNFALIGLFSNSDFGVMGFIHTMLSHGIISTAMFYIIGYIYSNLTFRDTIRLSGISTKMPKISFYFFIFSIANIGIPLFSGFPGEFFILISVANYNIVYSIMLIVPFMLTGYYNFYQINKLLFNVGQSNMVEFWKLNDANRSAEHILFILLLWCIILGLFPDLVFLTI